MRGAAAVPAVTLGVSSGYCLIVQLSDNSTKGRSMPLEIVPKTPLSPDVPALQAWLAPHWPAAASGLRLSRLAGGQSNPTWLLTPAQGEPRVLRAKPGPQAALLPSAHAIEREFAVLQALQGSEVPVPRVHRFCADESVIGAAFYLMAYVPGRVLRDASLPGMSPAERTALHDEADRVLAALHRVDWRARGLQDFGRTEAYFERLIARWTRQYRASQTCELPAMERLIEWLPAHIPASARDPGALVLLHGDFRLENMVFHPSEPRVLAVLDWELATLGHPLSDLAYHAMAWHHPRARCRAWPVWIWQRWASRPSRPLWRATWLAWAAMIWPPCRPTGRSTSPATCFACAPSCKALPAGCRTAPPPAPSPGRCRPRRAPWPSVAGVW